MVYSQPEVLLILLSFSGIMIKKTIFTWKDPQFVNLYEGLNVSLCFNPNAAKVAPSPKKKQFKLSFFVITDGTSSAPKVGIKTYPCPPSTSHNIFLCSVDSLVGQLTTVPPADGQVRWLRLSRANEKFCNHKTWNILKIVFCPELQESRLRYLLLKQRET